MKKLFCLIIALCAASFSAAAQQEDGDLKIPAEVARFVEGGTRAIRLETADLNGDGRSDFVLVLERRETKLKKDGFPLDQCPLLILARQPDKSRFGNCPSNRFDVGFKRHRLYSRT